MKHDAWMRAQRFEDKALEATFAHYRATLEAREAAVEAIEADLAAWFTRPPFQEAVARLGAYRGITHMGALHLASEVCDWRRFPMAGSWPGAHSCGYRAAPAAWTSARATARSS